MDQEYAYQIQGALEDRKQNVKGFRVFLWTSTNFYEVDIPEHVFPKTILQYMKYRMMLTKEVQIQSLPENIQRQIRDPIGKYLNTWVLGKQNGD